MVVVACIVEAACMRVYVVTNDTLYLIHRTVPYQADNNLLYYNTVHKSNFTNYTNRLV